MDWHLVQHIPASVAHSIHSLGFCAPPCRDVRRTRVPWSSTRASTQAIRARRVGVGRPHGLYPPPTDPRIPHRVTQLRRERSLHPWKVTNSTRARAASALGFLCRSCGPSVRGRCVAPTRLEACLLFGRRVGVVPVARRPSRRVPLTGLRRSPGHLQLPTSGKARCACCARRGRSGAPRGSPASLRRARPTRRFPH